MNIRNKFLLPTILLIVLGMGAAAAISYVKSKKALSTALLDNIEQRAGSAAMTLQTWLKDRKLDLKSWSHEEIYAKSLKNSIIGKAARVTANEKLALLKMDYGYYEDLILLDPDGSVVASSDKAAVGKFNLSDREYFKAAMAGNVFVSNVAINRKSGNPVIFVAAPVTERKQISGVLAGIVSIGSFTHKFIDPIKVGDSGHALVIDKTGLVVAHPDASKIMKENLSEFEFRQLR